MSEMENQAKHEALRGPVGTEFSQAIAMGVVKALHLVTEEDVRLMVAYAVEARQEIPGYVVYEAASWGY
ncbi:MAG: hypothetical protein O7G85_17255 [Planctomycetota bacterium]|nr:hypothetical protein [Planctomycetota bacterium]